MMDSLKAHAQWQLLRYSITSSRDFSCRACRSILDVRRAVMLEMVLDGEEGNMTICAPCWDHSEEHARKKWETAGATVTITDGRDFDRNGYPKKALTL